MIGISKIKVMHHNKISIIKNLIMIIKVIKIWKIKIKLKNIIIRIIANRISIKINLMIMKKIIKKIMKIKMTMIRKATNLNRKKNKMMI